MIPRPRWLALAGLQWFEIHIETFGADGANRMPAPNLARLGRALRQPISNKRNAAGFAKYFLTVFPMVWRGFF